MLPDFTKVKNYANKQLLRWVHQQVPALTPLIRGVATFRQHEGRVGRIRRDDQSEGTIDYRQSQFKFEVSREEMRSSDIRDIQLKLLRLAKEIGEDQEKRMLEVAKAAADSTGNVVNARGELTQETFLEVFRRVQMDFDPITHEPAPGLTWVVHPDTAASDFPRVKEWENDPEFKARHREIIDAKREEWRDREANRKLVS